MRHSPSVSLDLPVSLLADVKPILQALLDDTTERAQRRREDANNGVKELKFGGEVITTISPDEFIKWANEDEALAKTIQLFMGYLYGDN